MKPTKLKTTALVPVFGSGMPELVHLKARTIVVNDRHSHIIKQVAHRRTTRRRKC